MKTFENIQNNSYDFSSCEYCDARCCDGARGSTYAQIILEDFENVAKHFPIVFTRGELQYLMPVVLLSNGIDHCKYIKNYGCAIYEERPSICKVYPLSPYVTNEIYIDVTCPAVIPNENNVQTDKFDYQMPTTIASTLDERVKAQPSQPIVKNGLVVENFNHEKLDDYQSKVIETFNHFSLYNYDANLQVAIKIRDMVFYRFNDDVRDEYLDIHRNSLNHLDDDYYKMW